jgi:hypothetical protein
MMMAEGEKPLGRVPDLDRNTSRRALERLLTA